MNAILLHNRHISLSSDPYVKVWLMHKDKRVEKKKTVVMKRCLNPVFNESFPFDVPAHVLRETTIIITVMDKDRLSRNDVIGKVSPSHSSSSPLPLFFFFLLFFSLFLCVFLTVCQTISRWSVSQSLLTPAGSCSLFPCAVNELICSKQQAANFKCKSKSVLYLDLILQHLGMAQRQMQIHTVSKLHIYCFG